MLRIELNEFLTFKKTQGLQSKSLEAAGLMHPSDLNRRHIVRRLSESQIKLADQIYPKVEMSAAER